MTTLAIRTLNSGDAESLNALRIGSYIDRYGDRVDVKALRWNPSLANSLDLGVFEDDVLVSAYRIDCVSDSETARFALQTSLDAHSLLSGIKFPFAIGCRACTRVDRQARGFHFILRLAAVQLLRELNIETLVSTFATANPWTATLRSAGYEVFESKDRWSDFLKSDEAPSIAVLNLRTNGQRAVTELASRVPKLVSIGGTNVDSTKWGAEILSRFPQARAWSENFTLSSDRIRFERIELNPENQRLVAQLRQTEFQRKFGENVDLAGLAWNRTDTRSVHFGAWSKGELVSTLRLTNSAHPEEFQGITLFDSADPFVDLPCAILARAATNRSFGGHGLGMKLRLMAYEHWLESSIGRYIYGTAFADSMRLKTLREWGYEFAANSKPWSGYLKSGEREIAIFRLSRDKLAQILPRLKSEFSVLRF